MTDFGKAIRILRIENDRKQKQDADDLGVTASYISAIENGKKKVSDKYLEYCIKTYGDKDRLIELAKKQNHSIYVFKDVDNGLDLVCRAINEVKDDEWPCVKDMLLDMVVVRCKDCAHLTDNMKCDIHFGDWGDILDTSLYDFCSSAKPKDEEPSIMDF